MDHLDFSEEEIQQQLAALGYKNIPKHRLREFKQVSNCPFKASRDGFFLHPGPAEHERQVLTTCENRDPRQGCSDSYAQHSVSLNPRRPAGAPGRLQEEEDPDETLHPPLTDSLSSTPDSHRGHFIKRKVLRKHKGQSLVCDESIYSEDSDAASFLEERLADLRLSPSAQRDFDTENEDGQSEPQSSDMEEGSLSAFESYIRGMTRAKSDGDLRPKPKSFIRPVRSQQTIKKTDPVAKYFHYKQLWEMFTLPGESDRRAIRMEIKEQLAYQPPAPKPRRVFVPNSYVVPTEKKRSALRWEIRNDLANGLLPHGFSYR
ncbi:hypothetical protein CgunFtcFv8_021573 [Champsocephalus gunnari]|uniref:Centriolar and ciliogenesis-associated protein HYLS1 C-terminal domain-containing protein n=1 Tax=Champsocephalus gunnari TaxID=52237 RepID=A0AAN8DQ81_CHAGU|nr:hypothetical protein CgunFtcFv8_021573 [Champsocephalus gunnari]